VSEAVTPAAGPEPSVDGMIARTIPSSGETVPAIGLGTWSTFDVDGTPEPLQQVMRSFVAAGGRVIDSSPMYGRAEEVVGRLLADIDVPMFLATKVWTRGRDAGVAELARSMQRMGTERLDLAQVHNLLDVDAHLPALREAKAAGRIRYIGITHWQRSSFAEMEALLRKESLDFVQLPYSVGVREAEERLLPAAADTGAAVLVMRPFQEGGLFERVRGRSLPDWAAEIDCTSWAQVFLKWILAHPAVTCPIPATSDPDHLRDNMGAGRGRLPDDALRRRIVTELGLD
jgi:aryl-alcohol dehydrogenase-like predicted oxidoreductase